MVRYYLGILTIFITTISVYSQTIEPMIRGTDLQFIGKLKPRTTHEIVGSDLWIGGEVLDRDYADYDAYKEYLDSLGAKKIRLQSGWAKTEKVKGVYDFSWLDAIVDDVISRSMTPWIQISYGNTIYPGGGGISLGQGLPSSDVAYQAWLSYTRALVDRYKDRVNEWEIWNEADHLYENEPPEAYAKLFVATARVIRDVQPNAKIIGLSIANIRGTKYVDTFFNYLKENDALHLIDAATIHGYPKNPDDSFDAVEELNATIYKYLPGLPLWQGETGCPSTFGSSGALSGHPWTEQTQAKWNLRRAINYVGRGHPFSLFTISEYTYNDPRKKGLNTKGLLKVNDDLSVAGAKPAFYAYQNLTSILDHQFERTPTTEVSIEIDSATSIFTFQHKIEKSPLIFYWINSQIPQDEYKVLKTTLRLRADEINDPVLIELISGSVYQISKESIKSNDSQLVITDVPIFDSPIALVDKSLIKIEKK